MREAIGYIHDYNDDDDTDYDDEDNDDDDDHDGYDDDNYDKHFVCYSKTFFTQF